VKEIAGSGIATNAGRLKSIQSFTSASARMSTSLGMGNEDDPADVHVVSEMAADLVARHGENAPCLALEHEDDARRRGNDEDADAWLEIAAAATEMIHGIPIASTRLKLRRRPQ
jgi:hypothetical protein